MRHKFPLAIIVVCSILLIGCTASIKRIPQHSTFEEYDLYAENEILELGMDIIERPNRHNPSLNQEFSKRGILAVAVKLKNKSRLLLSIPIEDWALVLEDGQRIQAIRIDSVARIMTGSPFGRSTQKIFLFYEDVRYQYLRAGLPDTTILNPQEEIVGFIFFAVEKEADIAKPEMVIFHSTRFNLERRQRIRMDLEIKEENTR